MKTTKEIIHSLFYEAVYFAKKTPVSEFEKYNEYSKNFAKSFNRLIKEIDDPDDYKEIIDWCITNDELLTIEIIATELKDNAAHLLKRKYGVLKNLFLNEISIIETTKKPITTLKDFFPSLQPRQIESLQNEFSKCRGIEMACFIHKINKDGHLELIKNSSKKSLSKFCNLFAEMDKKEYEAVRKLFKYDTYILDNETYLTQYKTEKKINTALKVG